MTAEEKIKAIKEFLYEKEKQDLRRRENRYISCGEYIVLRSFIDELKEIIGER